MCPNLTSVENGNLDSNTGYYNDTVTLTCNACHHTHDDNTNQYMEETTSRCNNVTGQKVDWSTKFYTCKSKWNFTRNVIIINYITSQSRI